MKRIFSLLVLVSGLTFAQMDLSTPGGESVLLNFTSSPPGAEVYVANTFIGKTPTSVRVNPNVDTRYLVRAPSGEYQDYRGYVNLAEDDNVNVRLEPAGSEQNNRQSLSSIPETAQSQIVPQASTNVYIFADLPWLASKDEVRRTLTSRGYELNSSIFEASPFGDFAFNGTITGKDAFVAVRFNLQEQLVATDILIITNDTTRGRVFDEARTMYESLKMDLTKKYGQPTTTLEFFSDPYYLGDGYETQAFEQGKANYATFWFERGETSSENQEILYVEIDDNVNVAVHYASAVWGDEVDRRRAEDTSDF